MILIRRGLFSSLLMLLLVFFSSCLENEPIAHSNEEEFFALEEGNVIPVGVTLDEVVVNMEDGFLSFPTVTDYRTALHALANSSDEEYLAWSGNLGFTSQYSRYLALLEEATARNTDVEESMLTKDDKSVFRISSNGILCFRFPSTITNKIMDQRGVYLVDGDMNFYNDECHVVIDGKDEAKLARAIEGKVSSYKDGIGYQEVVVIDLDEASDDKVAQLNLNCPMLRIQTQIFLIGKKDAQTIGDPSVVRPQELRTDWRMGVDLVSIDPFASILTYNYLTTIHYGNWKNQWGWRRTFPNLEASYRRDNPGNSSGGWSTDPVRVDRSMRATRDGSTGFPPGQMDIRNDVNVNISEHTTILNRQQFSGSSEGDVIFDDVISSLTYNPSFGDSNLSISYATVNGTSTIRWTNRGKNLDHDPMSVEWNCQ